jgi:hypothetical protein
MNTASKTGRIEIISTSGLLRIIVRPAVHWVWAIAEGVGILFFVQFSHRNWHVLNSLTRAAILFGIVSAVVSLIFVQTGREVIQFGPEKLTITKDLNGWERKREYRIEDCRELQLHAHSESDRNGLECKVGWRRIAFGRNISENEALEILVALQSALPLMAQKLCSVPEHTQHFTTLGLS